MLKNVNNVENNNAPSHACSAYIAQLTRRVRSCRISTFADVVRGRIYIGQRQYIHQKNSDSYLRFDLLVLAAPLPHSLLHVKGLVSGDLPGSLVESGTLSLLRQLLVLICDAICSNRLEGVISMEVSSGGCLSNVGDGCDDAAGEKSKERTELQQEL